MTFIASGAYSVTAVLASSVADDATFTVGYPSGTVQGTFDNGNYKAGSGRVVLDGQNAWDDADPGIEVTTFGASTITLTNRTGATLAAGTEVVVSFQVWTVPAVVHTVPVYLMTAIANGYLVTNIILGIDGYITNVQWVQNAAVTTAAKLADLNLEIGTTNLTGGVVSLTSAACTPMGKVIAGTRITANNRITKKDTLSVEASNVTAFLEGSGHIVITIRPDAV